VVYDSVGKNTQSDGTGAGEFRHMSNGLVARPYALFLRSRMSFTLRKTMPGLCWAV
jgi:hypothetical protein